MRKKAYIYPVTAYADKTIPNPYLENFMDSLEEEVEFLNRTRPSRRGVLDLAGYSGKIDLVFLNWIEDIPDKRGGLIQLFFFLMIWRRLKSRRVRIVWTMHNKLSHYQSRMRWKRYLFRFLVRRSDLILTHSSDGIRYASDFGISGRENRVRYFPHPLTQRLLQFEDPASYDILIWGSIIPYKNIDKFLKYLQGQGLETRYRILLAGKVKPQEYAAMIEPYCNENIILDDRYIPEEELIPMISRSRVVVFTHAGDSVLSSGVLMDSLSYGATVIGPDVAAFSDAGREGVIQTFRSFGELVEILDRELHSPRRNNNNLEQFIRAHTWPRYAEMIQDWIKM